jgi:hypothetical protein
LRTILRSAPAWQAARYRIRAANTLLAPRVAQETLPAQMLIPLRSHLGEWLKYY